MPYLTPAQSEYYNSICIYPPVTTKKSSDIGGIKNWFVRLFQCITGGFSLFNRVETIAKPTGTTAKCAELYSERLKSPKKLSPEDQKIQALVDNTVPSSYTSPTDFDLLRTALRDDKIDVDRLNNHHHTPLMLFQDDKHADIYESMIEKSSNLNITNVQKRNVLMLAITSINPPTKIIHLLIKALKQGKIDIQQQDTQGRTAVDVIKKYGHEHTNWGQEIIKIASSQDQKN